VAAAEPADLSLDAAFGLTRQLLRIGVMGKKKST
jgi:hypothetical protein